ncbi:hypothetical protein Pla108_29240 [Botrimarina colliarenosi]|uniref:DUF4332 domain-containing protein n=1 Tax=Botrimarina colliarenosi TaxID=2528001 RepID=A0A5C6A921_9BACT|nr:DUF4332 domain-containing protein [Botrimarina colliarenosi]TWT95847.1 hypothetical protein Pla108_29240 [Botrimarina colliarenosi]
MRINQLITHRETSAGSDSLGVVSPRLAAYQADSFDHSGAVAGLVAEIFLGTEDPRWRDAPWVAGEATISVAAGELRLRRAGSRRSPKLTLASVSPRSTTSPVGPESWQQGTPASVLGAVFFAAAGESAPLSPLLSAKVAEEFTRLAARRRRADAPPHADNQPRRTDELLRRRDELAARIEALLGARRQESGTLDRRLAELDAARTELADQVEELLRRVRALAGQLDAAGAHARYEELSRVAAEAEGRQAADQWAPRVEELDEEVARWRSTLAELDGRETYVRAELARVRADDVSPQIVLADQRASVAVAQRLIADLESEVARFARSGESPLCVCQDAHPRLNPLVETLGRHVDRLAELVSQQDHALRTQELMAEAAQLERSQAELRRQLEHLLERRQTHWRSSRARSVRGVDAAPGYLDRFDRPTLEAEHRRLAETLAAREAELEALDRDRRDVSERRRRLLDAGQLAAWQRELDALQADLSRVADTPAPRDGGSLRASDVLARLSDGEFTELRLAPGGRAVEARDRSGRIIRQQDLSLIEQRLVAWALRLALADACHAADITFPLVADQPFADLDDRHAANLATCLDDYSQRGRQVLLMARDGAGLNRLRSLGVEVRGLRGDRVVVEKAVAVERVAPPSPPPTQTVVREETFARSLVLDIGDSIERFPVRIAGGAEAFASARVRTIGDLIGGDPSAIAEELQIEDVTAELVALWQAHLALVCFTPGLDLGAAKLLVECDLLSVEELAEANADRLRDAMRRRGAGQAMLDRIEEWVEAAADGVERWQSTGYAKAWRRNREERRQRIRDNASRRSERGSRNERSLRLSDHEDRQPRRHRDDEQSERRSSGTASSDRREEKKKSLRFYLETDSEIEAAPSIGPKRAEQLIELGVARVSQLLAADPEDLAARLDDSRIDAATIVAWQHQAELMCRVPGLRGHDAQVLVGSGFTSAEEIAGMKPAELLGFVDPFCDTSEGQRALRGSARPDLVEVTEWIQGARQRRAVGAA